MVPRSSGPVLFLGAASGVVVQDVRVVVGACGELTVVGDGRRVRGLILGVGEDSTRGVTTVGALERDLEGHVEEIFLEDQIVIVVRRTVNLRLLVGGRLEQTDDLSDGGHRYDAGGDGVSAGAGARERGSCRAE